MGVWIKDEVSAGHHPRGLGQPHECLITDQGRRQEPEHPQWFQNQLQPLSQWLVNDEKETPWSEIERFRSRFQNSLVKGYSYYPNLLYMPLTEPMTKTKFVDVVVA